MKFGLLYETQWPYEGTDIDWNALYKETLASSLSRRNQRG